MIERLRIFDDFAQRPEIVRELALKHGFESVPFKGHVYHGIGRGYDPMLFERIAQAIGPIEPCMQFFRIGKSDVPLTTYIHADVNCGDLAAVLYLNPQSEHGGTAFWRHRELGIEAIPNPGHITPEFAERINADGNVDALWEQTLFVPMRWNRLIVYPTKLFHSRYPNAVEAATAEAGRLVWCGFFNLGGRA